MALLGLLSGALLGCDRQDSEPGADPSARELESRSAAVLQERSDVRIQVAGQATCRGCTRSELARLWRVKPRRPFPKEKVDDMWSSRVIYAHAEPDLTKYRWQVKFVDEAKVRLAVTGQPTRNEGGAMPEIDQILSSYGVQMVRAIPGSVQELDDLAIRAMQRSLNAQPDLAGIYQVEGEFANKDAFLEFGRTLNELDVIEYVEIEDLDVPPPGDIPPETPDFSAKQGYLYAKSGGVDAPYAWELGIFGQGIKVSDCEFSWDLKHEEFSDNPLTVEKGQTLTSSFMDHGTAVMGVTSATHGGFGVKGIAPKSEPWVFPEKSQQSSSRRLAAVTNAIKGSGKGDIVMLEMQMTGPGGGYGPAEVTKSIWSATKTGTDAGVVVIGAAGNGSQDLDSGSYSNYRSWGDSGLIMVGAGSNNTSHTKLGFSTYGKRVDVQGWGTGVFTAGYGSFKRIGGDSHQSYSNSFNGTSSATPTVVGAALLIQSYAKENLGAPYTPAELRKLLKETGTPQGGGKPIGPLPNVKKAIESVSEPEENPPKVKITSPEEDVSAKAEKQEDGQSAYLARIEVEATDDSRVKEVFLEVDGQKQGDSDNEEPYAFDLSLEPGSYKIKAVAVDRYDNKASTKALKIKVTGEGGDDSDGDDVTEESGDPSADSEDSGDDDSKSEAPSDASEESDGDSDDGSEDSEDSEDGSGKQDDDDEGRGCKSQTGEPVGWLGLGLFAVIGWVRRRG